MLRAGASLICGSADPRSDLLLDDYVGGVRAYSLRRIKKGYMGYAIRVRRASDDEEADVAFDDDGEVSTDSKIFNTSGSTAAGTNFNTWAGATAYIKSWYDQVGGNHSSQTIAASQPLIKSSSSLTTLNSKTAAYFAGNDFLPVDSTDINIGSVSVYFVGKNNDLGHATNQWPWGLSTDASEWFGQLLNSSVDKFYYGGQNAVSSVSSNTNQHVLQFSAGASEAPKMYRDNSAGTGSGTRETDDCAVNATNGIGGWGTSLYPWQGYIQEFIVFDNDTNSNRANITSNIDTFYDIY
tara:strand:- start:174 stop:1058 length:885 start_codon:yes stop_codon:yes gene_type:complete